MTMTPEERAVIQAAIADHRGCAPESCGGSRLDPCRLGNAIEAYRSAQAASPRDDVDGCACSPAEKIYCASSDCKGGSQVPIWVARTWVDVRSGDDVRLPGTENYAHVQRAVHLHWHVDPRTGTSAYNPPIPMQWSGVHVTLYTTASDGTRGMTTQASEFTMDPAKPIDIRTTQLELDAIELLGGWPARVGMITGEATR